VDDSSVDAYTSVLENRVLPYFGDYSIDKITAKDVQDFVNKMKLDEYAPRSIYKALDVLRMVVDRACGQYDLPLVAWKLVEKPKIEKNPREGKKNRIDEAQLAAAFAAARQHYPFVYPFWLLLATTGLRFCHVAALRWDDLDEDGTLWIRRKWYKGADGPVTAIKNAPEAIKLDPYVVDVLREHRQAMVASQVKGLSSGRMFPNRNGRPLHPGCVNRWWHDAQTKAKIAAPCTVHGIRHTFHDITRRAKVPSR
jgi:integrase